MACPSRREGTAVAEAGKNCARLLIPAACLRPGAGALRARCACVRAGAREGVTQLLLAKRDVARIDRVARIGGRQFFEDGQSLACLLDRRGRLAGDSESFREIGVCDREIETGLRILRVGRGKLFPNFERFAAAL